MPLVRPAHGPVEVVVRPEDVRLEPSDDGDAVVVHREFYGHDQILILRLETGRLVRARLGPTTTLRPGHRCHVSVDSPVHAYPAEV
jgi:iron(III) transport system ATP-binding protein